ncbi:Phosphatidylinositol/phosphatidylcholine transfer protein SFH2 [Hondaea fermentalgiana]|uniref:Phosphatidylinositol/phosphatidylcholine transfer protein SFH2 n=1 Tax=Hondaea fermentalgiana TaxID=2315210 RepID=A0A2R5GD63_9STRA|nr:Phosphatidylinositol/phosphatidylcholine transfer protein SFH2 [Hondaea fermentalgiana]|eukprot:GBG26101.1 Phosphatidylinositol/phosphatidylcholine transfer protein SFH2 [Hondaea fermentalgiana]
MLLLVTPRALAEHLAHALGVDGGLALLAFVVGIYAVLGRAAREVLERGGLDVSVEVQVSLGLVLVGVLALLDVRELEQRPKAKSNPSSRRASSAQHGNKEAAEDCPDSSSEDCNSAGRETTAGASLRRYASSMPLVPSADLEPWWTPREENFSGKQEAAIQELLASHFGDEAPAEKRKGLERIIVNGDARAAAIRALVARQFDVSAARKLVDDMLQWRAENHVDEVLKYPIPEETLRKIRSCLFDGFCGVCNQGCPVYIVFGGRMDLAECKRLTSVDEIVKYHVQVMEYNMNVYYPMISRMTGRTTSRVTMLLDLKGFGGHNVKPSFWETINGTFALEGWISVVKRVLDEDNWKSWKTACEQKGADKRLSAHDTFSIFFFVAFFMTPKIAQPWRQLIMCFTTSG